MDFNPDSVRRAFESQLKTLVDIPSVSSDPAHLQDIQRAADTAAQVLKNGGARVEVIDTKGNPVVVGEFESGTGSRTVTIYNHLDVQPAAAQDWDSPPFAMKSVNGKYFGRGTTDDKGPALTAFHAAAFCATNGVPLNIRFVWELEEEIGSPSFENFLIDNLSGLSTDSVVVSDTVWISREQPAVPYGLRGLQCVLLRLTTGQKDVHSGLVGGLARNPIGELAAVLAECYDPLTGRVQIPGFYEDVKEVSDVEISEFVKSGFSVRKFMDSYELLSLRTTDMREAVRRIWAYPTFEVHGITGGYNGPGVKTIVPHYAEAKVSMRLVPDQDPQRVLSLLRNFIQKSHPDVEVTGSGSLKPYLERPPQIYEQSARSAIKHAFGKEPVFTREGGSIGAVVGMREVLKCPIIFLGLSLPEHGYHAVNENYDWSQASGGMRMFVDYFSRVATL